MRDVSVGTADFSSIHSRINAPALKDRGSKINTKDSLNLSKGIDSEQQKMADLARMAGQVKDGSIVKGTETDPKFSKTLPLDKHLKEAAEYILGKTAAQYPGFRNNLNGMSRKGVQIQSHLKDFIGFVKEKGGGDFASLPDEERKDIQKSAAEFIADKIGEEYGMAPHMRRNPMLMSPIKSNVSDYLEYLGKNNVVLTADEKGEVSATRYFTKEKALEAIGAAPTNETGEAPKIVHAQNSIIIGGVKLPVNK